MAVSTEQRGEVLVVTIDRPEARNAFDAEMITELREIFERAGALEPETFAPPGAAPSRPAGPAAPAPAGPPVHRPRAIVLRSTGDVFCAGGDLGDMKRLGAAGFDQNLEAALEMGAMFRAVRLCAAPVVARVQGPAYGGGVGLCCACDLVVASRKAAFAFSEVRLGLVAGVIAPLVIGRLGQAAARHWLLTGDRIEAYDALRIGLADRLADPPHLDREVERVVDSLLRGGPAALGRVKALIEGTLSLGFDRSLEFTARMIAEARTSPEAQAALAAFFERRPAPWVPADPWRLEGDGGIVV